jgi:hypothetical protein
MTLGSSTPIRLDFIFDFDPALDADYFSTEIPAAIVSGKTRTEDVQTLAMVSLVVADYDEALAFYVGKLGSSSSKTASCPSRTSAGWSSSHPAPQVEPNYCWRAAPIPSRSRVSATRRAGACSCSCTPMISGATSTPTRPGRGVRA